MAPCATPLVTLTTDLGVRDPYVATMKGTIYSIDRRIQIVDLTHDIAPQDVSEGALFLASVIPHFPPSTVHIAVIDPGVGTDRHPIAVSACGQTLLCPDNGLPTLLLRQHAMMEARIITNPAFMRGTVSATFHGRDVFAPAAARLATGAALKKVGEELDTIVMLDIAEPVREAQLIRGEIVHVDRFGNLVSNIDASMLGDARPGPVWAGRHRLPGVKRTYAEVPPGTPLALFGSSGFLEIAINGGNAQAALRLARGGAVSLKLLPPETLKGAVHEPPEGGLS
jgi:S-adenosylmethionine hydrolase